jgi:hypothetical protein
LLAVGRDAGFDRSSLHLELVGIDADARDVAALGIEQKDVAAAVVVRQRTLPEACEIAGSGFEHHVAARSVVARREAIAISDDAEVFDITFGRQRGRAGHGIAG